MAVMQLKKLWNLWSKRSVLAKNKSKSKNRKIGRMKKWIKLGACFSIIAFITGVVLTTQCMAQGESALPESLLSYSLDNLDGNSRKGIAGSVPSVVFGEDVDGNKLEWWVIRKNEDSLTLYAKNASEKGVYNNYKGKLSNVGYYDYVTPNSWVISCARAFLGRNQGRYPLNEESRTGSFDAATISGDSSPFESKYFTQNMVSKINPTSVVTYGPNGDVLTSIDRFWIPCAVREDVSSYGNKVSANPVEKITQDSNDGQKLVISQRCLAGDESWTRSVFEDRLLYLDGNGNLRQGNIDEVKGYRPVTNLSTKSVNFISSVEGNEANCDGVFKPVSKFHNGPYYLKFGHHKGAFVNVGDSLSVASSLNIPYSLELTDKEEAYLMAFMTDKDGSGVYFSSNKISSDQNETTFDLSNVPAGKYELKVWIEISEEKGRGLRTTSPIVTSRVDKGFEIKLAESEHVKFFDTSENEITGSSIIVPKGGTFSYFAKVDENYNMGQLTTNLIPYGSSGRGITLNPVSVSSQSPFDFSHSGQQISPLVVGGAIVTQGLDNVVYQPRMAKNYWNYTVSDVNSDFGIMTFSEEENKYFLTLSTTASQVLKEFKIGDLPYSESDQYVAGQVLNMGMTFNPQFNVDRLKTRLVPKDFIDRITLEDGTEQDVIKEAYMDKYMDDNFTKPLILQRDETLNPTEGVRKTCSTSFPDFNSDLVLFMEGEERNQYRVTFSCSDPGDDFADLYSMGELYEINGDQRKPISRSGIFVEYGKSIKFAFYPTGKYRGKDNVLRAKVTNRLTGISATKKLTENCYEWEVKDIDSEIDISIGNFELTSDVSVEITPDNVTVKPEQETNLLTSCPYGSLFKFKVKPEDGYEWGENGVEVKATPESGELNLRAARIKRDNGYYSVIVYSASGQGITENIKIQVSGAVHNESTVTNLSFGSSIEGVKFYKCTDAEVREYYNFPILSNTLGSINGAKIFKYGADSLKQCVFNFPLESASIKKDDSTDSEYEQEKYLLSLPSVNFEIPGDVSIASMTGANPTYSYTGTLAGMTESENVELKLDLQRLEAGENSEDVVINITNDDGTESTYNATQTTTITKETSGNTTTVTKTITTVIPDISQTTTSTESLKITLDSSTDTSSEETIELTQELGSIVLRGAGKESASVKIAGKDYTGTIHSEGAGNIEGLKATVKMKRLCTDDGQNQSTKFEVLDINVDTSQILNSLRHTYFEVTDVSFTQNPLTNIAVSASDNLSLSIGDSPVSNSNSISSTVTQVEVSEFKETSSGSGLYSGNVKLNASNLSQTGFKLTGEKYLYFGSERKKATYELSNLSLNLDDIGDFLIEFTDVQPETEREFSKAQANHSGTITIPASGSVLLKIQEGDDIYGNVVSSISGNQTIGITGTVTVSGKISFGESELYPPEETTDPPAETDPPAGGDTPSTQAEGEGAGGGNTEGGEGTEGGGEEEVERYNRIKEGTVNLVSDSGQTSMRGVTVANSTLSFSVGSAYFRGEEIGNDGLTWDIPRDSEDKTITEADGDYIWVDLQKVSDSSIKTSFDTQNLKKFFGDITYTNAEKFSGVSYIFRLGTLSENSQIIAIRTGDKIISLDIQRDIELSKNIEIYATPYKEGDTVPEIDMESDKINDIHDFSKLAVSSEHDRFKFKIVPCNPDACDVSSMQVSASGTTLNPSASGEYIANLSGDTVIKISGIKTKTLNVTYPNINDTKLKNLDGSEISSSSLAVPYGSDVSFVIYTDPNKNVFFPLDSTSSKISTQADGSGIQGRANANYNFLKLSNPDSGTITNIPDLTHGEVQAYTIAVQNIVGDISFDVDDENLKPQQERNRVILRGPEVVTFECTADASSNLEEIINIQGLAEYYINPNSDLKFKMSFDENYQFDPENVTVKFGASATNLEPDADGVYTLSNVKNNDGVTVQVLGLTRKQNYIRFQWDDARPGEPLKDAVEVGVTGRHENFVNTRVPVYYNDIGRFYVKVLDKYSDSYADLTANDDDSSIEGNSLDSNNALRKAGFKTKSGVKDDIMVKIGGITPNKSSVQFIGDQVNVYDESGAPINGALEFLQGSSFTFFVQSQRPSYYVDSIKAINDDGSPVEEGTNVVSETGVTDNGKIQYKVENLKGKVFLQINVTNSAFSIIFQEGTRLPELSSEEISMTKFWVEKVTGNGAKKLSDNSISVEYNEDVNITFGFHTKFDKFDGGKTSPDSTSGIGSITLGSGIGNLTNFVKNNEDNQLQITASFTEESVVLLNNFEVNKYSIEFPESVEGYTMHQAVLDEKGGSEIPSSQIPAGSIHYVPHGEPYSFFLRPLGGGFDPDASSVTAILPTEERITITPEKYLSGEYYKYTVSWKGTEIGSDDKDKEMDGVLRDVMIEIMPKKKKFTVNYEGYNVSFYSSNKTPLEDEANKDQSNKSVVESGSNWIFYVKADFGYNLDNAEVKTSTGAKVIDLGTDSEGYKKCQIDNITVDTTVIVTGAQLNTYRIQFKKGETSGTPSDRLSDIVSIVDDSGNKLLWDSDNSVLYGVCVHSAKFRFKYTLADAYTQSNLEFKVTSPIKESDDEDESMYEITPATGGFFEVSADLINKGEEITISVNNIIFNSYKLSFAGVGVNFDDGSGNSLSVWNEKDSVQDQKTYPQITHKTGEFVFRVRENIEDGYSIEDKLEIKATNGIVVPNSYDLISGPNGSYREYTISNVLSDTTVTVIGAKSMFYTIDFKSQFNQSTDSSETPPIGLKILDSDGRDISSGIRASNGKSVKFSVALDEQYTQSVSKIKVSRSDKPDLLELQNGYYTVENIKNNLTVNITELSPNTYGVHFKEDENYDLVNFLNSNGGPISVTTVEHGKSYRFVVEAKDGYEISQATVEATNCNVSYSFVENHPKWLLVELLNVTGDAIVTVDNLTLTLYNVTFEFLDAQGGIADTGSAEVYAYGSTMKITNGTQVYYGKTLEFRVDLNEAYSNSFIEVSYKREGDTSPDGTVINPVSGYYSIRNINSGITVKIKNIQRNKYSIKLAMESSDKNNCQLTKGTEIIQANSVLKDVVEHGGEYEFTVTANEGYNVKNLSVTTRYADVQIIRKSDSEALVTLSNIISNLDPVDVRGITKNTYLVSFTGTSFAKVYDDSTPPKDITTSGKEISYRGNIQFTLQPHVGYDQHKDEWQVKYETKDALGNTVKGNVEIETNGSGELVYKFYNVIAPVTISIENVKINTYEVTFVGAHMKFLNPVTGTELTDVRDRTVEHGGYQTFKVKADTGYDLLKMGLETNVGELVEEYRSTTEAIYSLKKITKDAVVSVSIDKTKVEVTLSPGTGTVYLDKQGIGEIYGKQTLPYGDKFEFAVGASEGYDITTLQVYQGKKAIESFVEGDNYRVFSTDELTADCEITTTIEKKKYTVSFPLIDGVRFYENNEELKGGESIIVRYGDSVKFNIALDDKHDQSNILVKSNLLRESGETQSHTLAAIDGFYTITEISSNVEITVENVEINKYKINLVSTEGITYNSKDGLTKDIAGIHVVSYADTFEFTISANEGYEISKMVVTVKEDNGSSKAITPSKGVYSITDIKGNKTITVGDQAEIQYKVTFEAADGVTYVNDTGINITDPVLVTHGRNFEFTIQIADAYDDSVPVIQTSSAKTQAQKLSTGRYLLSGVTEDMTVKTLNVKKNRYNVTLKEITGVIYKSMNGQTLTGDQSVEHEGTFQFRVELKAAYTESLIKAMDGSAEIRPESDGSFLITGIMEHKTVTVTGVEENPEIKVINAINALRDSIRDAADVDAVVTATKMYNQLTGPQKSRVTNIDKLLRLQGESGTFIHTTNDITVDGIDWYIKLVAIPLSASSEEMGRMYKSLNTEFILSLYDIYLWDMMADRKYTLPEGEKVTVTIPTPDLTYFEDTFIVHEKSSDGKLEYLLMNINGPKTSFEMTSFSPVGMAAKRCTNNTHSSFFDTEGSNVPEMNDIISSSFRPKKKDESDSTEIESPDEEEEPNNPAFGDEDISDKFKPDDELDARWSVLRLLCVLSLGLAASIITVLILKKKRRQNGGNSNSRLSKNQKIWSIPQTGEDAQAEKALSILEAMEDEEE